jgi:hypothetical protein
MLITVNEPVFVPYADDAVFKHADPHFPKYILKFEWAFVHLIRVPWHFFSSVYISSSRHESNTILLLRAAFSSCRRPRWMYSGA